MSLRNIVYDVYRLKNTGDLVKLTLTVGYAQDGNSIVRINNEVHGQFFNSFSTTLGTNQELNQKELKISSLVQDIQVDCEIVSVNIILSGGREIREWTLFQEPTLDHEIYPLSATIGLFH